ncbi:hypothetical protein ACWEGQ_38765 [Streptomyces seoulensis]
MSVNGYRRRPGRGVFALAGAALALAFLGVVGAVSAWAYFIYRMSDPATVLAIGVRVDGSRVSVKFPTCPFEEVRTVEVYDRDSEKLLWKATGPRTAEGRHGTVTLWRAADFSTAAPRPVPATRPEHLDVVSTYAGTDGGTGGIVDVSEVASAHVPEGTYWTDSGPRTAAQLDAQLTCRTSRRPEGVGTLR